MDRSVTMRRRVGLSVAGILLAAQPWLAAAMMVTVKATLMAPPPCEINGGRPIEVEFNEVMTTRVDGKNYQMPINYTIQCNRAPSNLMKLQIQGQGASFDSTVLKTREVPDLGIELRQKNGKLAVGGWLNFTMQNSQDPPELWAVPVKKNGATLKGGDFNATATMKVAYQ
ncbi:fimbrial protein [Serratia ureilytica]|uniref:fimbrial protein n=1 Tax=Serratia ureilytica TaxID=300181 RepID=UPI001D1847E8|nr:fimbrial protein [Serratia ureilytica]MCC4106646.1 fimbrial protein [Serratia ureilytica]